MFYNVSDGGLLCGCPGTWRSLGAVIMFRREQAQLGQARMGIIRHNRAGNGPKVVIMRC